MSRIKRLMRWLFRKPAPVFTPEDLQRLRAAEAKRKRRQEKRRNDN